jgi:putative ABC transport system permease protein
MTREPGRVKPPLNAIAGVGAAAGSAFAVVMLACVLIAVAGPRAGLAFRTHTLQRVFASALATQKLVEASADWADFDESVFGPSVYAAQASGGIPLTPAQIATARDELAGALTAVPLPLAARSTDWSDMTTALNPVAGAAQSAHAEQPPRMEIIYRDRLARHSQLIHGRLPATATTATRAGTGVTAALEVAVTEPTAARFGLRPGSRLVVSGGTSLKVTGIIRPTDPGSGFWTLDSIAAAPKLRRSVPFGDPLYWMGGAFVGPGEISALQAAFGRQGLTLRWAFPLSLGGIDADHVQSLSDRLNRVTSESVAGGAVGGAASGAPGASVSLRTVALTNGLLTPLAGFLGTQAAVQAVLALLYTGLTVLGATALLLAARLLAERRRATLALMRARGASLRQLAALTARDAAVVAVPAAAVGAALGVAITPGGAAPLSWWLAGATLLVPLIGLPAMVAAQHRGANLAGADGRTTTRKPTARKARARRWIAEAALVAAAVGGLVIGRRHGVGGANLYTSAAPVLVAVPAALLILRIYPVALRGLLWLVSARARAPGFVGLATAARSPLAGTLPAFALVLALTMGAFGGMMRGAVVRGDAAAAWRATGADARIDLTSAVTAQVDAARRAVAATPGVRHLADVVVTDGSLSDGTELPVAAVDPASYARLAADTPLPGPRPAKLSRRAGPVPVIASPGAVDAMATAGTNLQLPNGDMNVRVAVTAGSTPALPGADVFVVMPLWALHGGATPNLMLVTGRTLDEGKLTAALSRSVGTAAEVTFRSEVLTALAGAPLQHGAYVTFALGIAEAAGLSAAVLLLSLALGARARDLTLARLSTMGLDRRQRRILVLAETLPAILAAVAGGVACAWVLAPLIGPALDLSVFTGSPVPVPVRADFVAVGVPAAGLIALGLLTLTSEVVIAGRRSLSRMLRVDG